MSAGLRPRRRTAVRSIAWGALAALALCASRAAAGEGEPPPATFAPSEPTAPPDANAPSRPEESPRAWPPRELILRPHLDVGTMAGGPRLGLSFQGGLRIHPMVLVYSAFVAFTDQEYMTFSGVKLGYQRTLSQWWGAYAAFGFGAASFNGADGVTRSGSAAMLDMGFTVCPERAINVLGLGMEILLPSAPSGTVRTVGDPAVLFTVRLNPLYAAKFMR